MNRQQVTEHKAVIPASNLRQAGKLQRKCACGQHVISGGECEACKQKQMQLQRRLAGQSEQPNGVLVHEVLRSPGHTLDPVTRAEMESRFEHDFSRVRVHTCAQAAESARFVNALAYTVGQNIVFAAGQYRPETIEGRNLLAHELTHTVQQGMATETIPQTLSISSKNDSLERDAERAAQLSAKPGQILTSGKMQIARQEKGQSITSSATETAPSEAGKTQGALEGPDSPSVQGQAGRPDVSTLSAYTLPTCNAKAVKQWIKDPNGKDVFGLTTLIGAGGTAPEFKVDPVPGGKGVRVKPTSASLPPIQSEFLDVGQFPDNNLTFTQICQTGGDPGCQPGTFPVVWNVTQQGSSRLAEGENEHCVDFQLVFYLSLGLIAEYVNKLANSGTVFSSEAAARKELQKSVKIEPKDWVAYFNCLGHKAKDIRDTKKWHTPPIIPKRVTIGTDNTGRRVANVPIVLSDVKQGSNWVHSPWEVVVNSAMPLCNKQFPWKP